MTDYAMPEGDRLEAARRRFAELSGMTALMRPPGTPEPGARPGARVAVSRLYARAVGEARADDPQLDDRINQDPELRRVYYRLVAKTARYPGLELMAASTGVLEREGVGFRLRCQQSRAEPSQYYVMIELEDATVQESMRLIVFDSAKRRKEYPLVARDGVAQFMIDQASELLHLLRQPGTEVFLR